MLSSSHCQVQLVADLPGSTRAHIQMWGPSINLHTNQRSGTCLDLPRRTGRHKLELVGVWGGAGEPSQARKTSVCWGRTGTVGACVEFPTGQGSYGACPKRTDTKQSLWGEAPQSREMPALPGRTCQRGDCRAVSTYTEPAGQYS